MNTLIRSPAGGGGEIHSRTKGTSKGKDRKKERKGNGFVWQNEKYIRYTHDVGNPPLRTNSALRTYGLYKANNAGAKCLVFGHILLPSISLSFSLSLF